MPAATQTAALSPHPTTPTDIVRRIDVRVGWTNARSIEITYVLHGNCDRIRLPAPQPRQRTNELWRHSCFEAFVSKQHGGGYFEFNFSPSGEWAVYDFIGYRQGSTAPEIPAPEIAVDRTQAELRLGASVEVAGLALDQNMPLAVGLAAVVEDNSGNLSYWALRHPAGKPDFHHLDNFVVKLPPPDTASPRSSIGK